MRSYYCGICGQWFRAKCQMDIDHNHLRQESYFMLCKPVGLKSVLGHIGIKPIYQNSRHPRWRAMVIYIERGYSETPSWGHEAGGWIHYRYEAMRDRTHHFIEAATESQLVKRIERIPEMQADSYFSDVTHS